MCIPPRAYPPFAHCAPRPAHVPTARLRTVPRVLHIVSQYKDGDAVTFKKDGKDVEGTILKAQGSKTHVTTQVWFELTVMRIRVGREEVWGGGEVWWHRARCVNVSGVKRSDV